jgi:hypothetical protein
MAGRTWTVAVRRRTYTIEVKRKPWLAIGEIKVDGEVVAMFPAKALSIGLFGQREQQFEISGVPCMLKIKPGMINYDYELYVDGKPV